MKDDRTGSKDLQHALIISQTFNSSKVYYLKKKRSRQKDLRSERNARLKLK